jgi:hypothetical protein
MQIHQRMGAAQNNRFSNASASNSHNYISEENSQVMMGVSDEFNEQGARHSNTGMQEFNRGRQQATSQHKI